MIKAMIFDIGGVLVKTDEALLDGFELALKRNNIKLASREKVANAFGKSTYFNTKTAVETSYTGSDVDEQIQQCFEMFNSIFPEIAPNFVILPCVVDTLELLKNKQVKLAIFTGFSRKETEIILDKLNLKQYFELIVTVNDVKEPRPHPDALILATKKLKVNRDECIYVGDAMADIQMAKNADMRVVCVKTGVQDNSLLEKENPDFFAEDFKEMMQQLKSELLF